MRGPIELVVFDLDGTLADTIEDICAALGDVLSRRGLGRLDVAAVRGLVGEGARRLVEKAMAPHGCDVDDGLADFVAAYDQCLLDRTRLRPGALDAIAAARPAKVAICTNKPRRSTQRILDGLGLTPHVEAWVAGDDLPRKKPDALPVLTLAARLGAAVDRTVVIGDGLPDLGAARAAGAASVAVLDGYGDPMALRAAAPDVVLPALRDVAAWLAAQPRR